MDGWIDVKQELPQAKVEVMGWDDNKREYKKVYYDPEGEAFGCYHKPGSSLKNITHWMPLPQPPKTKKTWIG